jgi:hypothetical protein
MQGGEIQFLTMSGEECYRIRVTPSTLLADIYEQLTADHRAGGLGLGAALVDAVLPGGQLLSGVGAAGTVASIFG